MTTMENTCPLCGEVEQSGVRYNIDDCPADWHSFGGLPETELSGGSFIEIDPLEEPGAFSEAVDAFMEFEDDRLPEGTAVVMTSDGPLPLRDWVQRARDREATHE